MKFYIQTLGCKVNAVESDSISALLIEEGYTLTDKPEKADVILLNSCTVTASGDKRMFHALKKLRHSAPDAVIVLTGCYVQAFPEDASHIPDADIVTGTKNRSQIPLLLQEYFQNPHKISAVGSYISGDAFEILPQGTDSAHTRAFLKIQDGCNRFCTYCIIPYARGRCRSRPLESIQKQAQQLRKEGFQEIVLCGINLACWGQENHMTLADAVQAVQGAQFPRVRLGSLEPDGLTESVLERLAGIPELCPQFHISVQSGCDKTLKAMHRHYTTAEYLTLLQNLRKYFPDCAITTDIMTGFPDETESDFSQTLEFVKECRFSQMHIFRYSQRAGTPACDYPNQVPESVKKERADRLKIIADDMQADFLKNCIGKKYPILFERERGNGFHMGHAPNYALVRVPIQEHDEDWRNTIRMVKVTEIRENQLFGIVENVS